MKIELNVILQTGLPSGLLGIVVGVIRQVTFNIPMKQSWEKLRRNLVAGMLTGMSIGSIFPLLVVLFVFDLLGSNIFQEYVDTRLWLSFVCYIAWFAILGLVSGLIFENNSQKDTNFLVQYTRLQGVSLGLKYSALGSFFVIVCMLLGFLFIDEVGLPIGWLAGLFIGPLIGVVVGVNNVTKHLIFRLILWGQNSTPWNYTSFLDYCHDHLFLRKVGGGYIFIHRLLMEHFAVLTDEDIERIATQVNANR